MIDLKINDTVLFVLNKKVETSVIFEQENDEGILEFFITVSSYINFSISEFLLVGFIIEVQRDNSLVWFNSELNSVNTDNLISDVDLEKLLRDKLEFLIYKRNGYIVALNTHRWVDTDGFYEVQFELHFDDIDISDIIYENSDNYIYLCNKSGDQDLEDEWSESNPQSSDVNDFIYYFDTYDFKRLILDLNNFIIKK